VPLVLSDAVESITKTSKAVEVLKKIGAYADVEKAKDSKAIRAGKGRSTAQQQKGGCKHGAPSCT
jgi:large subunit ribosomal protein L4e